MTSSRNRPPTRHAGQSQGHRYLKPPLARIETGEIDPSRSITHRLDLDAAPRGYARFQRNEGGCIKGMPKP